MLCIAQFVITSASLPDALTTAYVAVTSQLSILLRADLLNAKLKTTLWHNNALTQHIHCVCVLVPAGVHEGDDGRLDEHHPHTRFQQLGTCSTAAERQARLKGSRGGLLEQQGTSAGESGSLSAYSLHQRSLGLSLRTLT